MCYVIYGKQPNTENEICLAIVPTPEALPGIVSSLIEKECVITEVKCYSRFEIVK